MINKPLVSIIIPTYNRAHLIGETLDSVLAQTYENWECIIVDDGSTDNTEDIILNYCKQDNRFSYYHRPKDLPKGGNAARNYGFEVSKGDYINWFDDDDIMLKNFIDLKVNSFTSNLNLIITTGYNVNNNLENKKKIEIFNTDDLFKEYCLWNLKIFTPSILFRRDFLTGKSLFNLNLKRGQETELFSRLFFKLPKDEYFIINEPLFLYRQHSNNKTNKNLAYINSFKTSQAYIAVEIFKKSLELKDEQLINHSYKSILKYFFKSIENNHKENTKFILENFVVLLKKDYPKLSLIFKIVGTFLSVINKRNNLIERFFNSRKLKSSQL